MWRMGVGGGKIVGNKKRMLSFPNVMISGDSTLLVSACYPTLVIFFWILCFIWLSAMCLTPSTSFDIHLRSYWLFGLLFKHPSPLFLSHSIKESGKETFLKENLKPLFLHLATVLLHWNWPQCLVIDITDFFLLTYRILKNWFKLGRENSTS